MYSLFVATAAVVLAASLVLSGTAASGHGDGDAKVLFEFRSVDYEWKDGERDEWLRTGAYVPENNAITGIKAWGDGSDADVQYFVTVPRWREGVPSTLNIIVPNPTGNSSAAHVLRPWPSWEYQTIGDPDAIQYAQSMEIDAFGRMWVIDAGRRNFLEKDSAKVVNGPPKLFLFDVRTRALLSVFVFPNAVAPWNSSFLNDIVVDPSGDVAFISDAGARGGLIAYRLSTNTARRLDDDSTHVELSATAFEINGENYTFTTPSDGIALHPSGRTLYYCALSGYHLYSLDARVFGDMSTPIEAVLRTIRNVGRKQSQSDGLVFSNKGVLYFGGLQTDTVYAWHPSSGVDPRTGELRHQHSLVSNTEKLEWVDTFGFDGRGALLLTSNRLQTFFTGAVDLSQINYRIVSVDVGALSYVVGSDESDSNTPE